MKVKFEMNPTNPTQKIYKFIQDNILFELIWYLDTDRYSMNSSIIIDHELNLYEINGSKFNLFSDESINTSIVKLSDISLENVNNALLNRSTIYPIFGCEYGNITLNKKDNMLYFIGRENCEYRFRSIKSSRNQTYDRAIFNGVIDERRIVEIGCRTITDRYIPMHNFYMDYSNSRIHIYIGDIDVLLERDPSNINAYNIYLSKYINTAYVLIGKKEFDMPLIDVLLLFTTSLDVIRNGEKDIVTLRGKDGSLEQLGVLYNYSDR